MPVGWGEVPVGWDGIGVAVGEFMKVRLGRNLFEKFGEDSWLFSPALP